MNPTASRPHAHYRKVDADSVGQRLDNFLLGALSGVPRSHVYRLIRSGQVRVNSGRVRAGYRLTEGDRVRVPPVHVSRSGPSQIPTNRVRWLADRILYEDPRILVLDKPAGMPVHAGTGVDFGCIEALRSLTPELRAADLVHRLDRGTSGCLLVAKRHAALRQLHGLLRTGGMGKRYLALVRGSWPRGRSRIDASLSTRRRGGESVVQVDPAGKRALSRFRIVERFEDQATLMDVTISTGPHPSDSGSRGPCRASAGGRPALRRPAVQYDVGEKGPETDVSACARAGVRLARHRGAVCDQFAAAV